MPKYVVLYRFTEHGAKDIRGTVAQGPPDARAEREARLQGAGAALDAGPLRPSGGRGGTVRGGDDGRHGQHRLDPIAIAGINLRNRFMRSATWDSTATDDGEVTNASVGRIEKGLFPDGG